MADLDDDGEATRGVVDAELSDRQLRAALAERIRHFLPARVETFDAGKQKADCKILIGDFHREEGGKLVTTSVPIVSGVPVMFLTGGGFTFTVPIKEKETTGALFFSDRSLDRWLSGKGQEVVDPELYHRHAMADGMFVPGLLTFANPMSSAPPNDHATAGSIAGVRIHMRDGVICIGDESGSDFFALGSPTNSNFDQVKKWAGAIDGVINGGPVNEPGNGSPSALQIALQAALSGGPFPKPNPADVKATQAKGK